MTDKGHRYRYFQSPAKGLKGLEYHQSGLEGCLLVRSGHGLVQIEQNLVVFQASGDFQEFDHVAVLQLAGIIGLNTGNGKGVPAKNLCPLMGGLADCREPAVGQFKGNRWRWS